MNKKKLIFLGILIALSAIILINKRHMSENKLKASSFSNHQNILSPIIMTKYKTDQNTHRSFSNSNNGLDKKKRAKQSIESQIPWEELHERWLEELRNFLITISDKDGQKMFNEYLVARENYLQEDKRLGERYQQIHSTKVVDPIKEDQFAAESAEVFDKATEVNKKIFGQYFSVVKNFHKEFENSIQVYSRDIPISLDFAFGD